MRPGAAGNNLARVYRNTLIESGGTLGFVVHQDLLGPNDGLAFGDGTWGDFDADGDQDLVITGLRQNNSRYAEAFRNDGTGSFSAMSAGIAQLWESDLALADLNNDGLMDLVITGNSQLSPGFEAITNVYLYFSIPNIFEGFFPLSTSNIIGVADGSIDLGDYNDDGYADLLLTGSNASTGAPVSRLYQNNGPGSNGILSFTEDVLSSNVLADLDEGSNGRWGDYDGDHKLDIVMSGELASNSKFFRLYRNTEPTANKTPNSPANLTATLSGFDMILEWDPPAAPAGLSADVVNGYTYNIYVSSVPSGTETKSPESRQSDGFRYRVHRGNVDHVTRYVLKDLQPGTYYWSVQAVDQDHEGSAFATEQDFEYEDPTFITQVNTTTFPNGTPAGFIDASVSWADYDRTGTLDFIIIGEQNGNRTTLMYDQGNPGEFVLDNANNIGMIDVKDGNADWGDLNNDGGPELLLTGNSVNGAIAVVYNNVAANGTFTIGDTIQLKGIQNGEGKWIDIDNDGWQDIVLVGEDDANVQQVYAYHNNGDGTLTEINTNLTAMEFASLDVGDYNNDGWSDLAITGLIGGGAQARIFTNDKQGDFIPGQTFTGLGEGNFEWGDFDADGWLDFVITGRRPNNTRLARVYRNDQVGSFTLHSNLSGVQDGHATFGDYDNDGDKDIILVGQNGPNITDRTVHLYQYDDGLDQFIDQINAAAAFDPLNTGAEAKWGDFDQDGKLDLIFVGANANGASFGLFTNINSNPVPNVPTPSNLRTEIVGNEVIFDWDFVAGSLPAEAYSFNLSIGTSNGAIDIQSPLADLGSGQRRIVRIGKVNDTTQWRIQGLADGTYSWCVQAIGPNYEGSSFSCGNFDFEQPSFISYTDSLFTTPPEGLTNMALDWGDYDNDGRLDLVLCGTNDQGNPETRLYHNDGNSFSLINAGLEDVENGDVKWGDLNGDNVLDLVLTGDNGSGAFADIYLNNGGSFTAQTAGILATVDGQLDLGDPDYDGDLDILITGDAGTALAAEIFRNDGAGNFTNANAGLTGIFGGAARFVDFNAD
ncbi:MAG: FG-GAP-like repeat-containing protein, partial [Bacteroidota bacterium]